MRLNGNIFAHCDVDWDGSIMEGKGQAKAGSGAFTLPVTFPARIGEPAGQTSPEELIAAAHAACFAMALNATVGRKGGSIAKTRRHRDGHRRQGRRRHQADDLEAEGRREGPAGHRQGGSSRRSRRRRKASARSRTRCAASLQIELETEVK